MRTFSEFQIMGHVGKVKEVGSTLRVMIAAKYGRKDDTGEFRSNTYWNEVTLFGEGVITWVKANVGPGDLVQARGTLRQTEYERDGAKVYGVTLAVDTFDLLRKRPSDEG